MGLGGFTGNFYIKIGYFSKRDAAVQRSPVACVIVQVRLDDRNVPFRPYSLKIWEMVFTGVINNQ